MASLVQTTYQARRIAGLLLIAVLVILGVDTLSKFLASPYNPFIQVPSFYLDVKSFADGQMTPVPEIPSLSIANTTDPTFVIEGAFSDTPDTVLAYQIERPVQKLNTVDNAKRTASTLGFTGEPQKVTEEELLWENAQKTRSLRFNIVSQVWTMRTQFFQDVDALKPKSVKDTLQYYEAKGVSIARSLGFTDNSIQDGVAKAINAKLGINGLFTQPTTAQGADYVVLDVFRQLPLALLKPTQQRDEILKNLPVPEEFDGIVYKTDPHVGSLHMITTGDLSKLANDIYEVNFVNYEYNFNYAVNTALTPQEAWSNITQGKGSLVLLKEQTSDYFAASQSLTVKRFAADASKTELAYWEPDTWDGYVYPIYIFRGRADLEDGKVGEFIFYVDALKRYE